MPRRQARQTDTRRRPFKQHLAAKPEELGGSSPGLRLEPSGSLDQTTPLDEPAEVLFVQSHAHERFNRTLKLEEGEGVREQLEHQRSVLQLAA